MRLLTIIGAAIVFLACSRSEHKELPKLGLEEKLIINENDEQDLIEVPRSVTEFKFINQDSNWVDSSYYSNKVYVVDFFFTTCPTQCPIMTANMKKVYESFEDNPNVMFLSYSIAGEKYDSVPLLKKYQEKIGVRSEKWNFVTGDRSRIFDMAERYLSNAMEDKEAPGGLLHSSAFLLMDPNHNIRGIYDGIQDKEVQLLIDDMPNLLNEFNLNH